MMTSSRQSGAAQLMLLIIVLVIALFGWGMWFMQYTDNEDLTKKEEVANLEAGRSADIATRYREAFQSVVKKVGGVPESMPEYNPDTSSYDEYSQLIEKQFVNPLDLQVQAARNLFDGPSTMTTLFEVVTPAEAMVNRLNADVTRLKNELETARSERDAAQATNEQLINDHNSELGRRTTELSQVEQRALAKEQQLEEQKNDLAGQLSDSTTRYEETLSTTREEVTMLTGKMEKLDRQVADVKREIRVSQERALPDGQIIDVNYKAGTCYINIGSRHVLRRGTRFRAYGFLKGGVRDYKGYIVVRDVERDRALCALEGDARPEAGNQVTNPFFDADNKKSFYFLGNLPGRFDNQRATSILESFNAQVTDKFSPKADFLILGDNPDPDAVGEDADPNWFKKSTEYNDAIRWNIEMMRAKDLEVFLQY